MLMVSLLYVMVELDVDGMLYVMVDVDGTYRYV